MIDIIIPTYKPDKIFTETIKKLNEQTIKPDNIIVVNTEEAYFDEYLKKENIVLPSNVQIHHIKKDEFSHGRTRNYGGSFSNADVCIFMTQDAIPYDERLIEELIKPLKEDVVAVYARQMAAPDASIVEKLTRLHNYPEESCIKSVQDVERLQIKAYFCSNVCCAYNKTVWDDLGGFVDRTIFNEDMLYVAKVYDSGRKIAYAADAKVIHSHDYTCMQQFRRNFDNGVSHSEYPELFANLKSAGEGKKMVVQVIKNLMKEHKYFTVIRYLWMSFCKLLGFKMGKSYKKLPKWLVLKCSGDKAYFMN